MLLPVQTIKSTLIAAVTALSIAALPANPALAWGDREQGIVTGIAATLLITEIVKNERKRREAAPEVIYIETPAHTTSIYRTPAARAFSTYSLAERKAIQRNLRAWGYYSGRIDGSFGPSTYNAVASYASDEGITRSLNSTAGAYGVYDSLIF